MICEWKKEIDRVIILVGGKELLLEWILNCEFKQLFSTEQIYFHCELGVDQFKELGTIRN